MSVPVAVLLLVLLFIVYSLVLFAMVMPVYAWIIRVVLLVLLVVMLIVMVLLWLLVYIAIAYVDVVYAVGVGDYVGVPVVLMFILQLLMAFVVFVLPCLLYLTCMHIWLLMYSIVVLYVTCVVCDARYVVAGCYCVVVCGIAMYVDDVDVSIYVDDVVVCRVGMIAISVVAVGVVDWVRWWLVVYCSCYTCALYFTFVLLLVSGVVVCLVVDVVGVVSASVDVRCITVDGVGHVVVICDRVCAVDISNAVGLVTLFVILVCCLFVGVHSGCVVSVAEVMLCGVVVLVLVCGVLLCHAGGRVVDVHSDDGVFVC